MYNRLKEYMDEINSEYGYKKYRSIAQLVEDAIDYYIRNMRKRH
ncbi:MAG: hypothetical protein NDF54_08575 [archaeon GB-1867-035]|nr:hypothetical protein [Candidatus Culexmicrobium profundum]